MRRLTLRPSMLAEIARFELAYQARRGWPWLVFVVLAAFAFLFVRVNYVADALYADFFVNSPFLIAGATVIGGLLWLLLAPAIAGEAAARDVATRMYPLVHTTPITKAEYLGGRFLAAFALDAVLLLAVQIGIALGIYAPGVAAEVVGPFRPAAHLTAYAYIALPNAFVATALQFWLASWSGRATASYLGSLLLVFMGFFVASLLLFRRALGTLLDPIGIRFVVEDLAHAWTTIEQNTRLIGLEGTLLANRLVWLGVGLAALALTYQRFRFAHRTESGGPKETVSEPARAPIVSPRVAPSSGVGIDARKTVAIAWDSFRTLAKSWAGLGMLAFLPALTVLVVLDQMSAVGIPLVPTTARVVAELTAPLSAELSRWVIVPLLIVYFAGELVWRERDARLDEIVDAMPGSDWPALLGKLLGLGLLLAAFMGLLMAAGMLAQAMRGHHDFEIGLYVTALFGLQLPEYLLFALLALAVHVLVNHKYVGDLVGVMAYVFVAVLAGMLGIEHNLLVYGAGPAWSYTEMRGFGASIGPWAWFKLYWAAWAVLLAVGARLLWVRGRVRGLGARIAIARHRLGRATAWVAGAAAALVVTSGTFVFYNANVRNDYHSTAERDERRAEYERRYGRYEHAAQPTLTGTTLRVEIHPRQRAAEIRGSYRLVNGGAAPIDSVHVATATGSVETGAMTFDRSATLTVDDERLGYRIYALARPLAPGDSLRLDFALRVAPRGFTNRGVDPSIAANGSAFHSAWLPQIGYQRQRELLGAADRRAHGLAPRPIIASLHDEQAREPTARGGGVAFEAVVGTDDGQIAVAPGALRRTWTEGRRRYFDYATDAPIGSEWSFFSARYAVHEARWKDVAIRVYDDPAHTAHVERTLRAVRAALDYYTAQFGPYPYHHLTIVEQGGAPGTGLHAEASIVSHGEGWTYWTPKEDAGSLDFPAAVVAHEIAHQWTLPYAIVEGAPFLSEGLAWYSAIEAVKASRGDEQARMLLARMREPDPIAPIHRGEPLLRALDPYMSYRKGPFAMYALGEYVGTDRVNGALRRLIQRHDSAGAPRVTTLDLYRELQTVTPDSLRPLLHDLFEVNTFWDLRAERVAATRTDAGAWRVTLDVRARKVVVDSAGVETEVPMNDWVEIGVFASAERGHDELSAPLYLAKHRIHGGRQTITVTVPREPVLAGVDPHHLLDVEERDDDDNVEPVKIERRREGVRDARGP